MDTRQVIKKLASLVQVDVDAVHAYSQVLRHVDAAVVRSYLEGFRDDHLRHIGELGDAIRAAGGEPPPPRPDLQGEVRAGLTALAGATGHEAALRALRALRAVEEQTVSTYQAAARWELPEALHVLVVRCCNDELRHAELVSEALETRFWMVDAGAPA